MIARHAKAILTAAVFTLGGCATFPEQDAVLQDARVAVYAAQSNPQVASYAGTDLDQAVVTLRAAEDAATRGARIDEVHRLARLAQQRAAAAQETARLRVAEAALAAQRTARDAQVQAELSRQQADAAQLRAAEAQRRAEDAQRQAAAVAPPGTVVIVQPSLAELGAQATSRGVVVTLNDAMFERDRPQLTPAAIYNLQKLAAYLAVHPGRVAIESFSDDSGNSVLDRRLSEDRALAARAALASLGVDPGRIEVHAYGDARPVASNSTAAGRQMNRRVEIVLP